MLRRMTHHMRHNVVAYLALFLAFSGTAIAARPLLTGADIQNDSLTGDDVLESSLATVPSATNADRLDGKDSTEFLGATAKAADADRLDGLDSSQLVSNQCPSGYTWDGSLCWEYVDVFGFDLAGAASRCRSLQARLPLLSDFLALSASGISLGTTVLLDWTASSVGDDETIYINSASGPNMDGVRANATVSFVRCVKNPVNALGSP